MFKMHLIITSILNKQSLKNFLLILEEHFVYITIIKINKQIMSD
jgi:hypothetical protein